MRHSLLKKLTSAFCAFVLLFSLVPAARAAGEPAVSSNKDRNCYGSGRDNWASTVKSYLYTNPSGGLTRVEYLGDSKIVAEDYSSSFQLQSSRTIPFELSRWGGFFAGESYNFFIFGQSNPNESDGTEVIRVVKYDKSWNRLGQYSLYGGNIYIPFDAGSLRCAEYGGYLYIRTCRERYKLSDGKHHQSSMTLQVRESDMTCVQYIDSGAGYVSHSFNQFVLVDSDRNVVTLDHGDAGPRAFVVQRFTTKAGAEPVDIDGWGSAPTESNIYEFPGKAGDNTTNATAGAFAETRTGYVSAFSRSDENSGWASRKIYLGYTHKNDLASSWTLVSSEPSVSNPHLAPTSLEGGYILWNAMDEENSFSIGDTLHYASYDTYGAVGTVMTVEGVPLSDCAPILYNGKSVWYTTRGSVPTFYALDETGVTATKANGSPQTLAACLFRDVPPSHWAYQTIKEAVDSNLANGVGSGKFDPSGQMSTAQFAAFLARAFYDVPANAGGIPWYKPYIDCMEQNGILNGVSSAVIDPINRYDMAQMLYNVMVNKGASLPGGAAQGGIRDWSSVPANYQTAVSACYAAGLITGMEDGSFSGSGVMTRAQGCTVLSRALACIPHTPAKKNDVYYSADEFCAEVFRLTNQARTARGLPALQESEILKVAAEIRAEEIVVQNSETRPNGKNYASVLSQVGITDSDINWRSENRFVGTFTSPEEIKAAWEASTVQTDRITRSEFTHMGVALYRAEDGKVSCVQVFSDKKQSNLANYRTEVVGIINQMRAQRGLPALQVSEILTHAAELAAMGNSNYIGTIIEQDLRTKGMDMVMSNSYRGSVNTADQVRAVMNQYLKADSSLFDATITHVGVGFYRQANGQEVCVQCFARVRE
ncbi:MAG: hypothetical protein HDT14_01360 [Oscillibacter sp.]|nr:hypothetical protein [Oscillibacter sp.]